MKQITIIIAVLALIGTAYAEVDSLWSQAYGGDGSEYGQAVIQLDDGGFILAGYTSSEGAGSADFWHSKVDYNGDAVWSNTYGGAGYDRCHDVIQTSDGGFLLAGEMASGGAGGDDILIVKTDANGDLLWSNTFDTGGHDECRSVIETTDGSIVMVGKALGDASWDILMICANEDGDFLWSNTFGGESIETGYDVVEVAAGGFAIVGGTSSFGAGFRDFWLVLTDEDGESIGSNTFGGASNETCNSIIQTDDGGFALGGNTSSFGSGSYDYWLVKTDVDGDSLWSRTYGGIASDNLKDLIETDAGFSLAGYTSSFGAGADDYWLIETNANGDSTWSGTWGEVAQKVVTG